MNGMYVGIISLIVLIFIFLVFTFSQDGIPQEQVSFGKPDTLAWKYNFDDENRLDKLVDPAGRETKFTYTNESAGGATVVKSNKESTIRWEYNDRNQLNSMGDAIGIVNYQYDNFGRVKQVKREGEPAIQYQHDIEDRLVTQSVGDFYKINYTYDFLGRLSSIISPAGMISYEYGAGQGQIIRKLPNGVETIWEFEPNGQLIKTTHIDPQNYILAEFAYQYRLDGLLEIVTERTVNEEKKIKYRYDSMSRLIHVLDQTGSEFKYEYDQIGNRIQAVSSDVEKQVCEYDWAGRLTKLNGKECSYDTAGNLNIIVSNDSMNYKYDQDCRLAKVNDKVFYKYDGDGKLIERKSNGERTKYISDPLSDFWQPLVMDNESEGKTLLIWDKNTPVISIKNGKPEFILTDHLGSARLIVDEKGKVKRQFDYDPFGELKNDVNDNELTPGFSGLFYDSQSKLYLTKARAYNPKLGQFMQIEPLKQVPTGSQKELTLYAYCGNDPVNFIDKNGAWPFWAWDTFFPYHYYPQPLIPYKPFDIRQTMRDKLSEIRQRQQELKWKMRDMQKQAQAVGFNQLQDAEKFRNVYFQIAPSVFGIQAINLTRMLIAPINGIRLTPIDGLLKGCSEVLRDIINYSDPYMGSEINKKIETANVVSQTIRNAKLILNLGSDLSKKDYISFMDRFSADKINKSSEKLAERLTYGVFSLQDRKEDVANIKRTRKTPDQQPPKIVEPKIEHDTNKLKKPDDDYAAYLPPPDRSWGISDDQQYPPGGGGGLSPSNVGGVYLGGAGQSLGRIGQIEGLSLDANNNLILISRKGDQINLPPMRIDDIVTVFRSVYLYGEGPTVTIDPNPKDPKSPEMIIKHDKATEETYVGWILFEADRLMKCYMLGKDNISENVFESKILGYQGVLNSIYFGNGVLNSSKHEGKWERFWIVPAKVNQFSTKSNDLTLFDVPLKVKTQVMKWEKGALVDDETGKSSLGASKFIEWFSVNFDAIAKEQYLLPPAGFGIKNPVPVFTELRQIAVITALAERMRDQGVPMPFWMRDYEVQLVQFEKFTPALTVKRENGNMIAQIFGGVSLSPESKDVRQFTKSSDLKQLPENERVEGEKNLVQANKLSNVVSEFNSQNSPVINNTFKIENETYQVTSIPGSETKALAPCRIAESDLIISAPGGNEISLIRQFHSFFNPKDKWGQGWTMDLPRLEKVSVPVEENGKKMTYYAYELVTPLNSIYAKFSDVREVPMLKSKLQVPDKECRFFGLADSKPTFLTGKTLKLIGKNGESLHFTEDGNFIASEKDGFRTVYLRDEFGNVNQIVGLLGKTKVATIDLKYNNQNKIISAIGKNESGEEQSVNYEYDPSGKLSGVISLEGKLGYVYKNSCVSEVNWQESKKSEKIVLHRYEYNTNSQLTAEYDGSDTGMDYTVTSDKSQITLKTSWADGIAGTSSVSYDKSFRPVVKSYSDGTIEKWNYSKNGVTSVEYSDIDGKKTIISESPDKSKLTVESPGQPIITATYDQAEHITNLDVNGQNLFKQKWSPYGVIESLETQNCLYQHEYDEDGLLGRILLSPPGSGEKLNVWKSVSFDKAERPSKIKDYTGLNMDINYDKNGQVSRLGIVQNDINYGYEIDRNKKNQITEVNSSWWKAKIYYDSDSEVSKMVLNKKEAQAIVTYNSGRVNSVQSQITDAAQMSVSYNEEYFTDLLSQILCFNGLKLKYLYDPKGKLNEVNIGDIRQICIDYDDKDRIIGYSFLKK